MKNISLFAIVAVFFTLLATVNNASASVFKVEEISVEYKSFNPQTIRKYAVDKASQKGFVKLMNAIVLEGNSVDEAIKNYNVKKTDLVEKVNIIEEINTKGRYFAKFNIDYNKKEIKSILESNRIPYAEETMGKVLLLPIKQLENQDLILFEESNVFKNSLFEQLSQSLLIKPILAKGDLDEITTYNPQSIIYNTNPQLINSLQYKYDADKTISVLLRTNNVDGQQVYQIDLNFINFEKLEKTTFVLQGNKLDTISKQISKKIEQLWIMNNLLEFDKPKRFVAGINQAGSLKDYEDVIGKLKDMKLVSSVILKSINISQAIVQTDFYGTPDEFVKEANKKGLNIYQDDNKQWIIERLNK